MGIRQGMAQNQEEADSLIRLLKQSDNSNDSLRLQWLSKISFNHNNPDSSLYYARQLASKTEKPEWLLQAYYNEGSALRLLGDLDGALEAYFKSLEFARQLGDKKREGNAYIALGDVYSVSGAHKNSTDYYSLSIPIFREIKDSVKLATALFNAGDEYLNQDSLATAVLHFNESAELFDLLGYPIGVAYNLGNMGLVYAMQGNEALALANIDKAITLLEEQQDYYGIAAYLTYMSDVYINKGDLNLALDYAERSLKLASTYGLKDQMSETNLKLATLHEQMGNTDTSYKYYKDHIAYRDSVRNMESIQQMADLETSYQVSQKQVEVDLLNEQKKTQKIIAYSTGAAMLLVGLFAIGLYRRNKFIQKTKQIIEKEKDRSEALLLNILPEEIAEELKANGSAEAREFDQVSILFSDFKEFTQTAEKLSAKELVSEINVCFKAFDHICEKYELEKIKTIGDAFMAAGGLPVPSEVAVKNIVLAGLEMQRFITERKNQLDSESKPAFEMRLGIHTGPVVAGIVGVKKFQYDLWGDTVNTASRMESNSKVGKVNISRNTYELLQGDPDLQFEKRGEVKVKGKGAMEMYFVSLKEAA
ncbi:adenylate/guanylate cyclase domain-containing protein [Muriicola sp. SD30]|uniref:adenylate/guanylate cyclase domain-containing protein n=1 Tax=Muriicola sp. SD30 TaxID=3240936 RepID=UPI0035101188